MSLPAVPELQRVISLAQTGSPEAVVEIRGNLIDVDRYLKRNDRELLLQARRVARVTEWHMAHRWPPNPDGLNRIDNRPPLNAINGDTDRVLWQNIYDVGRADIGWLMSEDDPDRLTQSAVIEIVNGTFDNDEWFTPKWLFDALGLRFDLDVCAPADRTYVSTPANRFYTEADDGLAQPWHGLVWCNPPYSNASPWAYRMIEHNNGLLLSHVPANGVWSLEVWNYCRALRLLQGVEFVRPGGGIQRPGYWLQLVAFGDTALDALKNLAANGEVRDRFRPSRMLV